MPYVANVLESNTKIASGPNFVTTKLRNTTITSFNSFKKFFNVAVFSSPRTFIASPNETARNTMASTAVLLLKAVATLEGTIFRTTSKGFDPVVPLEASNPERSETLKNPALNNDSPTIPARSNAKR